MPELGHVRRGGRQPERATPVTRFIAEQVRVLRRAQGLSGSRLAATVAAQGVPCSRTTIAKLETGLRANLHVDELLALAAALDVPISRLLPPEQIAKPSPEDQIAAMVRALNDLRRDLRNGGSS